MPTQVTVAVDRHGLFLGQCCQIKATCLFCVGQRADSGEGGDGPAQFVPLSVLPDIKPRVCFV